MITKVEGIILKSVNFSESSLVLQLFTKEYGIIGVMAKGAKKMNNKLHALTMNYTYGFFYLYYKEDKLSLLKEVDLIDPFIAIHEDITRISYLAYLSDLTYQIYKESQNENIYDLFIHALKKINEGFDPLVISNILEVKYLNDLGVGLYLDGCVKCGSTTNIVTVSDGGLICKNCYQNEFILSSKSIKLLRLYNVVELKSISNLNIPAEEKKEIDEFLSMYYKNYTGLYLKSKNFLDKLKDTMKE